ncbi:MAG: PilZ domain-containing protein [Thermoleophilia bacterium]|jgi:hypothetical protein|nr:PilZ domain-containing protein [Thermoleophilia bacterium]
MESARGERRAHRRVQADLPVRVQGPDGPVEGHTVNLSEGGVSVDLGAASIDARRLRIEIELAELGWHALDAEQTRSEDEGHRLSARFAEAAASGEREAIRGFLARYLPE